MVRTYRRGVQWLRTHPALGVGLCLAAGLAFSVQPVLGQLALDGGAPLSSLLGWRYGIAAVALALVARRRLLAVAPRVALVAFGMGVVVYAADAALFYAALERTSAPTASLLHYGHLVVVVGVAALLGRERLDAVRVGAVAAVIVGVALVGGGAAHLDALGITLALGAAGAYAIYILVSDVLLSDTDPLSFTALMTAGAATSVLVFGGVHGTLLDVGGVDGAAVALTGALVGSCFAVTAFLAGIRRVGPGTASLLVTIEVPAGLVLAGVILGERLAPVQVLGAALVVAAVTLPQLRGRLGRLRQTATVRALPVSAVGGEPVEALAA
jgi:drug/metabolite transporter (DMT)-like permease